MDKFTNKVRIQLICMLSITGDGKSEKVSVPDITIIGSLPGIKVRKLNLLSKNILFVKIY